MDPAIYNFIEWFSALLISVGIPVYPPLLLIAIKKAIRKAKEDGELAKCRDCGGLNHKTKRSRKCAMNEDEERIGRKRRRTAVDEAEEKKKKKGRVERDAENQNPNAPSCPRCGSKTHSQSSSKECPYHEQNIKEIIRERFGNNVEQYTRTAPLPDIVRDEYREKLQYGIQELCSFIRNVIIRVMLFTGYYFVQHGDQEIPTYIFSQTFFYSVAQLVMGLPITNDNPNMPSNVLDTWNAFKARYPAVMYPKNNFKNYSGALSTACNTIKDSYVNMIVEFFQTRVEKFIVFRLQKLLPEIKTEMVKKIANEYLYEILAGGNPVMPEYLLDATNDINHAMTVVWNELIPYMPRPCTTAEMAARPGNFIPALDYILKEFHLEHANAQQQSKSNTRTLPRLFSLAPLPGRNWRFVDIDGATVAGILNMQLPRTHQERLDIFTKVFDFSKYRFFHDKNSMFTNLITTNGHQSSWHFARAGKEASATNLQLEDFTSEEVDLYYRPCALDPSRSDVFQAAYGAGCDDHEVRKFSTNEYYNTIGSKRRDNRMLREKKQLGIEHIESAFPTGKTANMDQFQDYVAYYFWHLDTLLDFYNYQRCAERRFRDYQGRQRATAEICNILINGGLKYNKSRRRMKKHRRNKNRRDRKKTRRNRKLYKRMQRQFGERIPSQPESAIRSTITREELSEPKEKHFHKSTVEPSNEGKMPLIVFGAGMFGKDGVSLKGQRTGVVRIFYRELKKRESQGQAVIVTIDEYLTSQVCHTCLTRNLENLVTDDGIRHHKVQVCKTCGTLWDRDTNASKNMFYIASCIWAGLGRPEQFARPTQITTANVGP